MQPWLSVIRRGPWLDHRHLTRGSAQAGYVTHFTARPRLALAVKVEVGAGFGDIIKPALDVGADQIIHRRASGHQRRIAQRQAEDGAKMLLELRGMRALDRPV